MQKFALADANADFSTGEFAHASVDLDVDFCMFFFYLDPPKEDIFLTTFYGLYFSGIVNFIQKKLSKLEG